MRRRNRRVKGHLRAKFAEKKTHVHVVTDYHAPCFSNVYHKLHNFFLLGKGTRQENSKSTSFFEYSWGFLYQGYNLVLYISRLDSVRYKAVLFHSENSREQTVQNTLCK